MCSSTGGTSGTGIIHYNGESVALNEFGMPLVELGAQTQVATVTFSASALKAHRERFPAQLDSDRFELLD